jgi:hypothetical protein
VGDGDEVEGDRKFINLDRDRVRVSSFTNFNLTTLSPNKSRINRAVKVEKKTLNILTILVF